MKIIIFIFLSLFIASLAFVSITDNFPFSSHGNPSASEILDGNPDADILKLNGIIFSYRSESVGESEKGELIGEIKNQTTKTWWFWDLYATKIPEGTKVYRVKGDKKRDATLSVLVEIDNRLIKYRALIEG